MLVTIFFPVCLLLAEFLAGNSDSKKLPQENKQFIYVLRYSPEFKQAVKWTAKEMQIAKEHVQYLKVLMDEKKGYVVGRTTNMYDPELFGIVIFDAPDTEKAKDIMQNDPLIKNNIMQGTLNPFSIVFIK